MKETDRIYLKRLASLLLVVNFLMLGVTIVTLNLSINFYRTSPIKQPTITLTNPVIEFKPIPAEVVKPKIEVAVATKQKPKTTPSRGGNRLEEHKIINNYVIEICNKYNNKIEPELIMSVIQRESSYDPMAENGNHLGLMQVSTRWHADRAKKLGVTDFHDPYGNILLGVDYLVELLERYEDPRLVLMLYNMSHNDAIKMYNDGKISTYAKTIIENAETYKKGE